MHGKLAALTLATAALLLSPGRASAASDLFLEIPGIRGSSVALGHEGAHDVLAFSYGFAPAPKGSRLNLCQGLSLTKWLDAGSPLLLGALQAGSEFPAVTLEARRPSPDGRAGASYLRITLQGATIVAVTSGGSGGEDRFTENVSLAARSWVVAYLGPNGQPLSTATVTCEAAPGHAEGHARRP